MRIAIVTAGGAGMFCGSCMHDNTWVRSLRDSGTDACLVPLYTPIRVDEQDVSIDRVFFGGVNLYLESSWPFWARMPRRIRHWLDHPRLLSLATRLGVSNDARQLGRMTVEMLKGEEGPHRESIEELVEFLTREQRPDVIIFSNALLVGALRRLKASFAGKTLCVLQGDDVFLDSLVEPFRSQALQSIRERVTAFDGFIVHSDYYRGFMSSYLDQPLSRFHRIPLGIDFEGHSGTPTDRENEQFTIGYFARICPEKGLHHLIEAFETLNREHTGTRLLVGGYAGRRDKAYLDELLDKTQHLGSAFQYVGSPDTREAKIAFLKQLDVLSVPTVYQEPKGLYVLEALANGVPVVLPNHGAFPEIIQATAGGELVNPNDNSELAATLKKLQESPEQRLQLASAGHENVRSRYDRSVMAQQTIDLLDSI
jgi:glycosyltransferase involved in cell wall biosynthesis